MKNKQKGFTLIELLVVVLIIGILAAIAVPQYQKAVEKSRSAEALLILKSFTDAMNRYYLEHSTYLGITPGSLDMELPKSKDFIYGVFDVDTNDEQTVIYVARPSGGKDSIPQPGDDKWYSDPGSYSNLLNYYLHATLKKGVLTRRTCAPETHGDCAAFCGKKDWCDF